MEKEYSKYHMRWRNTIVESVHWPDSLLDEKGEMVFRFVIDEERHFYSSPISFEFDFDLDTSADIQFIKMKMDRYMVERAKRDLSLLNPIGARPNLQTYQLILEYVFDIFAHPYEWEANLP